MSTEQDSTRIVQSWLEAGSTAIPDRVLDAVLAELPSRPQRRSRWSPWRSLQMKPLIPVAVGAAAIVLAIVVGIAEESLVVYCLMDGSGIFTWPVRWMQIQQICGMNLGLLAGLLGNLLVLRMIGMRFMHGEKLATTEACSTAVGWDKLALANAGPPE